MKQTYSNVANSQNALLNQIKSTIRDQVELMEWEKVASDWQKSVQKAISSDSVPHFLIFPHTKSSLAQLVKLAFQNKERILPTGNSSKISWGGLTQDISLVISTAKLNQVIDYAEEDLTITVESGLKLADLQRIVAKKGQFLAIDPTYPDSATVGGIVATADTGSWRQRYGGVRDLLLGLSFVRFDGEIAKAGGKVVKNVAGYDLMKLFTGSYGSLGIISEVTFRLYPLPAYFKTLVITGQGEDIATLRQIIVSSGLTPTAADLISPCVLKSLELGENMGLMVRFQSIEESVHNQVEQLKSLASNLNLKFSLYGDQEEEQLWRKLKEIVTIPASESTITSKIGILASESIKLFTKFNYPGLINISSGIGRLSLDQENSLELLPKIRKFCESNQGYLTILESPLTVKEKIEPWGYKGNGFPIMQKIKQQFDPPSIFKPNYFLGNI